MPYAKVGFIVLSLSGFLTHALAAEQIRRINPTFTSASASKACAPSKRPGSPASSFTTIDRRDKSVTAGCDSVFSCNNLIAQCAKEGKFTPGSYDPDSGAPASGSCVWNNSEC